MRNLYLDPNTYDIKIGMDYNLKFTSNLTEYVSQKIENTLKTFKDEWFLNRDLGIPYFTRILIKGADVNDVNNLLRGAINNIPEVVDILEWNVSYDTSLRTYSVTFKVQATEAGDTETVEGSFQL